VRDAIQEDSDKVRQFTKWLLSSTLILSGIAGSFPALAVPSHFSSTIGSALLCQDQIDGYYFTDYMVENFGQPTKTEGGAYWWKMPSTLFPITLFGAQVDSIFVSQENTTSVFIGAMFVASPDALLKSIRTTTGISYQVTSNPERWISPMFSTLVYYNKTQTPSKLYCAK
jgi:hypothetical protein